MTNTIYSMTSFIPECNISFNGGDITSDSGAMISLDFIQTNHLLDPYQNLAYQEERSSWSPHNSNFSIFTHR